MTATVLTIAGSDPTGGAGLQADLKTFAALQVYGASAITAITAQNSKGVTAAEPLPAPLVVQQIQAAREDLPLDAIKTGMLGGAAVVRAIAETLEGCDIPLIVDPVLQASSGEPLLDDAGREALGEALLPQAALITPNLAEAAALTGLEVHNTNTQKEAAERLVNMGAGAALVTGGHLKGAPTDVFFDGAEHHLLRMERVHTPHTHGTGCTLSAAIAAHLARGLPLFDAIEASKRYLQGALQMARSVGRGRGPVHHMHPFYV